MCYDMQKDPVMTGSSSFLKLGDKVEALRKYVIADLCHLHIS